MSFARNLFAILALCVSALMIMAGIAVAGTVYDGSDYSYGGEHRTTVCDKERDYENALVENQIGDGTSPKTLDGDGAGGRCYSSPYYSDIYRHRTCETNGGLPDTCGGWDYHRG